MSADGSRIKVIGHAGMGIGNIYPLNSIESINKSIALGVDGVEIDVQMAKDGILVAYHHEKLEDATSCEGRIYEINISSLENINYKYPIYTEYKLATLKEVLQSIPNVNNYIISFDCKNFNPNKTPEYINTFNTSLHSLIKEFDLKSNSIIEFKHAGLIEHYRMLDSTQSIFAYTDFDIALEFIESYNLQGFVSDLNKITPEQIIWANENNIEVALFNARTNSRNIQAVELKANYIQTDRVNHLLRVLDRK